MKRICPNCGAIVESKFCTSCGHDLTGPDIVKICPNCGTETASKFCTGCGTKLFEEEKATASAMPVVGAAIKGDVKESSLSASEMFKKAKKLGAQKVKDLEQSAEAKRVMKEKEAALAKEKQEREAELLREQQKREADLLMEKQKREAELLMEQQKREEEQRREEAIRAEQERKLQLEKERREAQEREEEEERKKLLKKKRLYEEATAYVSTAENTEDNKAAAIFYRKAEELFSMIPGWEDADEKGAFCARKAKEEEIIVEKKLIEENKGKLSDLENDTKQTEPTEEGGDEETLIVQEDEIKPKDLEMVPAGSSEEKKKTKKGIIIVAIAVIIIAVILIAVFGGKDNNGTTSDSEIGTTNSEEQSDSGDTVSAESEALKPISVDVRDEEDGWIYYYVKVKNDTQNIINAVSVSVSYMNEDGDIIDSSYPQNAARVLPGQTTCIEGLVEVGETKKIKIDQFSFYSENKDYFEGSFSESLNEVDITKPGITEYDDEPKFDGSELSKEIVISDDEPSIIVKDLKYDGESDGYKTFSATVTNNTDKTINTVAVNMVLLNSNGNICGETYPQIENRVEPGQSLKIEGLTDNSEAQAFTVDGFSYYEGDSDEGEYIEGFFPTIPQAVKISN